MAGAHGSKQDESYTRLGAMEGEDYVNEEEGAVPASVASCAASSALVRVPRPRLAGAAAAAATAGLLLAAAAVVTRGGQQDGFAKTEAAGTDGSLQLFAGPYKDHAGQMVCPANFNNRGHCRCQCDWAQNGGCTQRADDNTCCFACCCSSTGGGSGFSSGQDYDHISYHGDTFHGVQPVPHVVHHVVQPMHEVHYHTIVTHESHATQVPAKTSYQVGERVFTRDIHGKLWPAVVTEVHPDGQYGIRYLSEPAAGAVPGHATSGVQPVWVFMAIVFVALIGLSIYFCITKK